MLGSTWLSVCGVMAMVACLRSSWPLFGCAPYTGFPKAERDGYEQREIFEQI